MPPLVTIRAEAAAPQLRSALATIASLSSYARAVSKTVIPASAAAAIVSGADSAGSRMQPRPIRSSAGSSQAAVTPTDAGAARIPASRSAEPRRETAV